MLSITDFIATYEQYTDEELHEIQTNISEYSQEAQEALTIVVERKGGLEQLRDIVFSIIGPR